MRSDLFDVVQEVLRGPCGVHQEISYDSLLMEDLGLDSMGMLALAVELENRFRIRLEEDPEQAPETVRDVVELLALRLEQQ